MTLQSLSHQSAELFQDGIHFSLCVVLGNEAKRFIKAKKFFAIHVSSIIDDTLI